jgi:hypothetical protein
VGLHSGRWMVVDEGSEANMIAGAERRQRAALAADLDDYAFVALPEGALPPAAGVPHGA